MGKEGEAGVEGEGEGARFPSTVQRLCYQWGRVIPWDAFNISKRILISSEIPTWLIRVVSSQVR